MISLLWWCFAKADDADRTDAGSWFKLREAVIRRRVADMSNDDDIFADYLGKPPSLSSATNSTSFFSFLNPVDAFRTNNALSL